MASHPPRGVVPSLLLSAVVVLVALGLARGVWLPNLHNGLLALTFTGVGAYVLFQRPGHREGVLFTATGVVEAVMFLGRQVGHFSDGDAWWAWLGAWPLALGLGLATLSVIFFPDGLLPSRGWRWVVVVVVAVSGLSAALVAVWAVGYDSAGVAAGRPFDLPGHHAAQALWSALSHPSYALFQALWVVAVVWRWRAADGHVRGQLSVLLVATAISVAALAVGLVGWGSPLPGLLTAALVPVAAGWAIVHGQHATAYSALTWLSRSGAGSADLPTHVARAVSEALSAPARLWMGSDDAMLAVGEWPETGGDIEATTSAGLEAMPGQQVRPVVRDGAMVGAISVTRADRLSLAEEKLLGDLAAQASLVIEHVTLAEVVARQTLAGHLEGLSVREHDVLKLMARGRSNAAICAELHLSIKTVEPVVSTIFAKLGLHADSDSNRRVLAVLAYLRS